MIDHLFIKNYKAFDRQNIPLDKNTLFIGTNNSGKSTILQALDLFFNHALDKDLIRDKEKDVVVEVHTEDERYRKTWSPPEYHLNFTKCIGDMFEINHIKYLYVPKTINDGKLLNDIMTLNLVRKFEREELSRAVKVFDYIDGIVGNTNYPLFKVETKYQMAINKQLELSKEDYTTLISNINYQYTILGVDNYEDNFDINKIKKITHYAYQTLFTTKTKDMVEEYDYFVHPLFKEDIADIETVKNLVSKNQKTYLLVEGKYDVAWFEQGLKLLELYDDYRVIPCGGSGNIEYIDQQLKKENIKTIIITDGDVQGNHSLQREVIELYADVDYINRRFGTNFKNIPRSKISFFKQIKIKDDIVKKILSSWARKNLNKESAFVQELQQILEKG
jgi:predicted ATP-dependent endonuclease of OLD family